ncbi:MAG: GAF domain-containing protein, partial [Bryobacteraceae bacterium]
MPYAAFGQIRLPLEQAGARSGQDFVPAHLGKKISVSGVVGARMYRVEDRCLLPIQDASHHGILLMGSPQELATLTPGDGLDVTGTVSARGGMPVLSELSIVRTGAATAPKPALIGPDSWHSFETLGVLVTAESFVTSVDQNADGDVATIGDRGNFIHVLLPRAHRTGSSGLGYLSAGDHVRVTGTLIQYLKAAPFDGGFYVMLPDSSAVSLVEKRTFLPPLLLLSALAATSLMLIIWWIRERRMAMQRRSMRILHSLSEEIIAAQSPADLARRLETVLPQVTSASSVRLYLFNSRTRSLERVVSPAHPEPVAFAVDTPPPGVPTGVAVCFRNRRLLSIPDTRRSPFLKGSARSDMPRAALFVPTFAHQELLGVLELSIQQRPHFYTQEEQAAAQHIANQVAAALKLQEQQTIREQLFRSEKLAATGQLISGVASELRAPLDTILRLSAMLGPGSASIERDARTLASEARRASEIVA